MTKVTDFFALTKSTRVSKIKIDTGVEKEKRNGYKERKNKGINT